MGTRIPDTATNYCARKIHLFSKLLSFHMQNDICIFGEGQDSNNGIRLMQAQNIIFNLHDRSNILSNTYSNRKKICWIK